MTVKAWILRSARLRCTHCGGAVYMQYKGRWSIRKAFSSATPQSNPILSLSDAPEKDEGEDATDG